MVVEFTEEFEKQLKKICSKEQAKKIVTKLANTKPTDGDVISSVANIIIKERKLKTFYFVLQNDKYRFLSKDELHECLLRFVALSKKNNQQKVINKLKQDLKEFGF